MIIINISIILFSNLCAELQIADEVDCGRIFEIRDDFSKAVVRTRRFCHSALSNYEIIVLLILVVSS
jgi:hypothetical protein